MKHANSHTPIILILITAVITVTQTACTTQSWYQGAKSAQTTQCMKEPLSEYEECNKRADKNYESYSEERESLMKENAQ